MAHSIDAPSSHLARHVAVGILLQASVVKGHFDDIFITLVMKIRCDPFDCG